MDPITIIVIAHISIAIAVLWPAVPSTVFGLQNFPWARGQIIATFLIFVVCSILPLYNLYHYVSKAPYHISYESREES